MAEANESFKAVDNCLIDIENSTLLLGCKNSVIPADGSVTKIGAYAFFNCNGLASIVIPEGVLEIGTYAFYGCADALTVSIPESLAFIDKNAFEACAALEGVYTVNSLSIWSLEFANATANPLSNGADLYVDNVLLETLVVPESVKAIKSYAFYDCTSIKDIILHDGIETIGDAVCGKAESIEHVYYEGPMDKIMLVQIGTANDAVIAKVCFYSASAPAMPMPGYSYWRYVDDVPVIWGSESAEA